MESFVGTRQRTDRLFGDFYQKRIFLHDFKHVAVLFAQVNGDSAFAPAMVHDLFNVLHLRLAAVKAGGVMVTGNDKKAYRQVEIKGAKVMKQALVHPALLDADVVINVPVLKNHGGATMTCAMKNYMGVVWDRRWMHKNSLEQSIADSVLIRKPDLNVVDAYLVMTHGGPTGRSARSRRVKMNSLLASRDILAIDTAAAKLLGVTMPEKRNYLEKAAELNLGESDLKKVRIKRIVAPKKMS